MQPSPFCPFCAPEHLDTLLATTEHFLIIADHAPLVPGHTLVIPREHYPCYGAVPADLDDELAHIRQVVAEFLRASYPAVTWFEHGVFHQTVFHAHLHAIPLGSLEPAIVRDPALGGRLISGREGLRAWYLDEGHYTFLEESDGQAAVFPAREEPYRLLLRALFARRISSVNWVGPAERKILGAPQIQALKEAWQTANPPVKRAAIP